MGLATWNGKDVLAERDAIATFLAPRGLNGESDQWAMRNARHLVNPKGPMIATRMRTREEIEKAFNADMVCSAVQLYTLLSKTEFNVPTKANVCGGEVLTRLVDPDDLSIVSPGQFIPAMSHEQLVRMGELSVHTACALAAQLEKTGYNSVAIATNVSQATLKDGRLEDIVHKALFETRISARKLIIEILEDVTLSPADIETIRNLHDEGVNVEVDDLDQKNGMTILEELARTGVGIDGVKISGHCTCGISTMEHPKEQCRVRECLQRAKELGAKHVTVEGGPRGVSPYDAFWIWKEATKIGWPDPELIMEGSITR